jgi:hypothetical protein
MSQEEIEMKKTLARFFGGAVMVCGALLGLATSAHAQSFHLVITADPISGSARQSLPGTIQVQNTGEFATTNVTVTLRPPKGAKVDAAGCQVDHFPGGLRSYTCALGTLTPGQPAEVTFSISIPASGEIVVEVSSDQTSAGGLLPVTIF